MNKSKKEYNYKRIHSTTWEESYYRFQNALKEGNSLWSKFVIPKPFVSERDVFCIRIPRTADAADG